jgi:hypothetical protein
VASKVCAFRTGHRTTNAKCRSEKGHLSGASKVASNDLMATRLQKPTAPRWLEDQTLPAGPVDPPVMSDSGHKDSEDEIL